MANNRKWTGAEEGLLLSSIEDNPDNLRAVFADVAQKIGRTKAGVSSYWYGKLSKGKTTVFMTIARKKYSRNRKQGKMQKKSCTTLWKKILNFFGL